MEIDLFLSNLTDDFNLNELIGDEPPDPDDVLLCWFDPKGTGSTGVIKRIGPGIDVGKKRPPKRTPTQRPPARGGYPYERKSSGTISDQLSFREESWGTLLLNRGTGRVYRLDAQAKASIELLLGGASVDAIAVTLGVPGEHVLRFVRYLLAENILPTGSSV
jgi:hypothetical protein